MLPSLVAFPSVTSRTINTGCVASSIRPEFLSRSKLGVRAGGSCPSVRLKRSDQDDL